MKLEEKIVYLRKQKGWSQEELAYQLGVSRQAVSKWESGVSTPEIDKISLLSELFNVTTDYLIKEDKTIVNEDNDLPSANYITKDQAMDFVLQRKNHSGIFSIAVFLCIISPIALIVLSGLSEYSNLDVNLSVGVGITILFVLVSIAVLIFISTSMKLRGFHSFTEDNLFLTNETKLELKSRRQEYLQTHIQRIVIGVLLCIISPIPLILSSTMSSNEMLMIYFVGLLLFIVGIGVLLIVKSTYINNSFQILLQENDFTIENKSMNKKTSSFAGSYWPIITGVYLLISFLTNRWDISWLVWPVAGVLFVGLSAMVEAIIRTKE